MMWIGGGRNDVDGGGRMMRIGDGRNVADGADRSYQPINTRHVCLCGVG